MIEPAEGAGKPQDARRQRGEVLPRRLRPERGRKEETRRAGEQTPAQLRRRAPLPDRHNEIQRSSSTQYDGQQSASHANKVQISLPNLRLFATLQRYR